MRLEKRLENQERRILIASRNRQEVEDKDDLMRSHGYTPDEEQIRVSPVAREWYRWWERAE